MPPRLRVVITCRTLSIDFLCRDFPCSDALPDRTREAAAFSAHWLFERVPASPGVAGFVGTITSLPASLLFLVPRLRFPL